MRLEDIDLNTSVGDLMDEAGAGHVDPSERGDVSYLGIAGSGEVEEYARMSGAEESYGEGREYAQAQEYAELQGYDEAPEAGAYYAEAESSYYAGEESPKENIGDIIAEIESDKAREAKYKEDRMRNRRRADKKKNVKSAVITGIITLIVLAAAFIAYERTNVHMKLLGENGAVVECGGEFNDPGAKAWCGIADIPVLGSSLEVTRKNADFSKVGETEVIYEASKGNMTYSISRTVTVTDTTAPEITLVHDENAFTLPGEKYEEEGYSAFDIADGDLTDKVEIEDKGDVIVYTVTDNAGNTASAERKIDFTDKGAPVISIGQTKTVIMVGTPWNDVFTATDNLDGDLTDKVKVEGTVDTGKAGEYTLKYSVKDSFGNEGKAERTVIVVDNGQGLMDSLPDSKIVFLTFDDGPGEYTERLLDILDKYNVKATFFVTAQQPNYEYLIGVESERGHAIGVHTFTHTYSYIYRSDYDFWYDFDAMNDKIAYWTGRRTNIMRFPGGSSNEVSAEYNTGIMSRLTAQAVSYGFDYFDWNVLSGDAGETTDPEVIKQNVINGMESNNISVVLMHDINEFSVDAVEDILIYGRDNGYTFLPLQKGIYNCRHGVNN